MPRAGAATWPRPSVIGSARSSSTRRITRPHTRSRSTPSGRAAPRATKPPSASSAGSSRRTRTSPRAWRYIRIAAKRGDQAALTSALAPLAEASKAWSPEAQEQLKQLRDTAAANPKAAATRVAFLKNFLLREPAYRLALAELTTPREEVGRPLTRFLRLRNPEPQPAAPDTTLAFAVAPVEGASPVQWVGAVWLTGEGDPVIASAGAAGIRVSSLPAPIACAAVAGNGALSPDAVASADLDYDFRTDLAVAGPGGVCLLRQTNDGRFTDVTRAATLPAAVLHGPAYGIWPADVDTDGDLDLVLAPRDGSPTVLRNNGDGTFTVRDLFAGVSRARAFAWADLDGEGVPDAALVDEAGAVHVFLNQRGGILREERVPPPNGQAVALAAADDDGDGVFDLLVLTREGAIARLSRTAPGGWKASATTHIDRPAGLASGAARLLAADLDNNGAADLVVSGPASARVLLAGPGHSWTPAAPALDLGVQAAADLDGDGRLDLVGRAADGRLVRASSRGTKPYHWQVFRTRATTVTGDQRINSFGIGGEIEMRSGVHTQKQVIDAPVVHFGLGEAAGAEVVRITWPNGALQSEFDTKADQTVKATQRLKGSCPWLFAWNGREMACVTDLLWRSPLGLRINAQATANVAMTEDWVKLAGSQLAPRDGTYDLRITAELWEAHFFDLVSLMAVDHPEGTEVFVDERFAVPPPVPQVIVTGSVAPFASVRDDLGGDVSESGAHQGRPLPRLRGTRRATRASRARTSSRWSCPRRRRGPGRCGSSARAGSTRPTARSTSRSRRARTPRPRGCRCRWPMNTGISGRFGPGSDSPRARTRRL